MIFLKTLISLRLIVSVIFIYGNHPLTLGLILIIQTILIAIILGAISQNFWFSYILFLVIIGGILIIFIYIISLIFNKIFIQELKFPIISIIFIIYFGLISKDWGGVNSLERMINYKLTNEISINLIKLYNFPMNLINLIIIRYLFFLLIVVVKITNFGTGPLRIKI